MDVCAHIYNRHVRTIPLLDAYPTGLQVNSKHLNEAKAHTSDELRLRDTGYSMDDP